MTPVCPPRHAFVGDAAETRTRPGTDRLCVLSEVLPAARHDADLAGMSRLADITGLDGLGLPAFNSVRPGAEGLMVTGGKGHTPEEAQVTALLEAVERWASERHDRFGPRATLSEVRQRAIGPHALVLDADSDYSEEDELEWWPCRDLRNGAELLVPAAAVLHPYEDGPFLFVNSSNGLATGATRAEATFHALMEVVERDGMAFGELFVDGPVLDPATIDDGPSRQLLDAFARAGVDVRVHVFTTDVGIPVFYTVADDRVRRDSLLINAGIAAALNPRLSVRRSLFEAAFSRTSIIAGARDDLHRHDEQRSVDYDAWKARYPRWFADKTEVPLSRFDDESTGSLSSDIEVVVDKLVGADLDSVLVADLTLAGMQTNVVRAVVPGAEYTAHTQKRFGPRIRSAYAERNA